MYCALKYVSDKLMFFTLSRQFVARHVLAFERRILKHPRVQSNNTKFSIVFSTEAHIVLMNYPECLTVGSQIS